jgi:gliding motility-associated-like protein
LSPNEDGENECVYFAKASKVKIYNLRGKLVRELEESPAKWTGEDNKGRLLEPGVYIYQIEKEEETISGTILLLR